MTRVGLDDMGLLPEQAEKRLTALSNTLSRMLEISLLELAGQPLEEADIYYIESLSDTLDQVVAGVEDAGVKTTMVADVHTDQNSQEVLEEGVGYVELIVAAYMLPNGTIALGAGPVLSHYEFRHPMNDRLTDEKWRDILTGTESGMPAAPEWTSTYRVE
jgi:ABC-type amino acid transport substrate-binding protein